MTSKDNKAVWLFLSCLLFGSLLSAGAKNAASGCTVAGPCLWSVPASWSPSGVPGAGDDVVIGGGAGITINITTATAHTVQISGKLSFSRVVSSTLTVTGGDSNDVAVDVLNLGILDMGSASDQISNSSVKATLILPLGTSSHIYGLIVEDGGVFQAYGTAKNPAGFATANANPGDTSVKVPAATAAGWAPGDSITIGQTEMVLDSGGNIINQTEERVIAVGGLSTVGSTTTVSWSGGLSYVHLSTTGVRVADVTRNVVVRSAGTDTASNTAYFRDTSTLPSGFSAVNAEFAYLGRDSWEKTGMWFDSALGSISSCTFHNGFEPINLYQVTGVVTFAGNLFYANVDEVISGDDDLKFIGNDIYGTKVGEGVGAFQGGAALLDGNYAYSNAVDNHMSIFWPTTAGFTFRNNWIFDNNGQAFVCHVTGTITNNKVFYHVVDGIYSDATVLVSSNTVFGIGSSAVGAGGNGIELDANSTAVGNVVFGNLGVGILLTGGSRAVGNQSYNNDAGIVLNGGSAVGNDLHGNFSGIRLNTSGGGVSAGNWIYNCQSGLWATSARLLSVDDVLSYDKYGAGAANFDDIYTIGAGAFVELRGPTMSVVNKIDLETDGAAVMLKPNGAAGLARLAGQVPLSAGQSLILDYTTNLYSSSATAPALFRGSGHTAQVLSTDDNTAVSQMVTIQYSKTTNNWQVTGSVTGAFGTIPAGGAPVLSPFDAGQFKLSLTPGGVRNDGDSLYFVLMSSSKDENIQKTLVPWLPAWWTSGATGISAAAGSSVVFRGVPGTPTVVDGDGSTGRYMSFVSSGSLTIQNATIGNIDANGLQLSGAGAVSITSCVFQMLGDKVYDAGSDNMVSQARRTYLTLQNLTMNATSYAVTFDSTTGRTDSTSYSIIAQEPNTNLRWFINTADGIGLAGDATTLQSMRRIYWLDVSSPATPSAASAAPGTNEGEINVTWRSPGDDGMTLPILGGSFRIFRTTNTADLAGVTTAQAQIVISTNATVNSAQASTDAGLLLGTSYYYRIWAGDEANNFSPPAAATSTAQRFTPLAVSNFTGAPTGPTEITLAWTAPSVPPANYLDNYRLDYSTVSASLGPWTSLSVLASTTSYVHDGLMVETTYYYRLYTNDLAGGPAGTSSAAQAQARTPEVVPPEVSLFSVGVSTVGVPFNPPRPISLTFTKPMSPGTVSSALQMRRLKNNLSQTVNEDITSQVVISSDAAGDSYVLTPPTLAGNSAYVVTVATSALGASGKPLGFGAQLRFVTLLDHTVHNVVTENVGGATVDVPPGSLAVNGYFGGLGVPASAVTAAGKLAANTGDPMKAPISGGTVSLQVFDQTGSPQTLSGPLTVSLVFNSDGNGNVLGTNPPVHVQALRLYWLDESRSAWVPIPGSSVNASARTVSAPAMGAGVYSLFGGADTSLGDVHAFPNPWRVSKQGGVMTFEGLGQLGAVKIYAADGRLVRELTADWLGQAAWDGTNADGQSVASGLYLYRVSSGGAQKTGKLAVIK